MRFIVFGAGAIGGVIGARLRQHDEEVTLIARGSHLEAIKERGLTIRDPNRIHTVTVDAVGGPEEVQWRGDEVVLLSVKSHQTADVLARLSAFAPESIAVVCVQNGINNEREALRRFPNVYACMVALPAAHLVPAVVEAYSAPITGILDLGRYPYGLDDRAGQIADVLGASGFSAQPLDDAMHWKRRKLIANLANAVEAISGPEAALDDLVERAMEEGEACFRAAGLSLASEEDDKKRRIGVITRLPIDGLPRKGNSSWQSLARGARDIETDYLNGEIVLLGRQIGVKTPVNELFQRLAREVALSGAVPGSIDADKVRAALAAL